MKYNNLRKKYHKLCNFEIIVKLGIQTFILLLAVGCSQIGSPPDDDRLVIATSIFPVYDMVHNITGDSVEVIYIIPPGANPHIFEPSPDEVIVLSRVDIYLGIDPDFDGWVEQFLPSHVENFYLSDSCLDVDAHRNPHIWLSLNHARTIVIFVEKIVSEKDSMRKYFYQGNLQEYLSEIEDLNNQAELLFTDIENNKFIQWHPAWDYLASDYNLKIIGTIESGHGDQPSISQMEDLIEQAKENQVKLVVIGLNMENPVAQTLADEIGGRLIRLDAIGDPEDEQRSTYLKTMKFNLTTLYEALK
ncbi:MAG: hypothetical protein APR63_02290 [Desulfuromonas sp. SDB]|nr:MAG: hypothetical protein APR63_02290 [Desulfuromonas sp. SDB]